MSTRRKPSGLAWATTIPERWDTAKVCLVARLESGHTPSRQHPEYWVPEECTVPWFSLADVWQLREANQRYLGDTAEKISPLGVASSAARVLPAGTVVLSRTASVGFAGIMPRPMTTTQDFANWICGPRLLPEYLLWAFRAMKPEFARMMMGSTHQTIYMPDIRRLAIPVPPRAEQRAISDFLDRKTAAIDAVVQARGRLLDLLEQKRRAVIAKCVSGDPRQPTRDSSVEWLGLIPAHWRIVRLSYVATVVNGSTPSRGREDFWNAGTVPWLSSGKVNDFIVRDADEFISEEARLANHLKILPAGTVLVGMVGQGRTRGMGALMAMDACINQNVAGVTPRPELDSEYLHFLLVHAYEPLRELAQGGQQDALNCATIKAFRIPLPPLAEQKRLVDETKRDLAVIESAVEATKRAVFLMREYRQALITAAVTGQLDIAAQEAA